MAGSRRYDGISILSYEDVMPFIGSAGQGDSIDRGVVLDKEEVFRRLDSDASLAAKLFCFGRDMRAGRKVLTEWVDFLSEVRDEYPAHCSSLGRDEVPPRAGQFEVPLPQVYGMEPEDVPEGRIQMDWGMKDGEDGYERFACPFGVGAGSLVRVGSEAEASSLYEDGLRGDADWDAVLKSLSERGLVKGDSSYLSRLSKDLGAQFQWMRERILSDSSLSGKVIRMPSLLPSDMSMGRSVFDYDHAPAPGHVLARYINNPFLLYSVSRNGVKEALDSSDKCEQLRFTVSGDGLLTILVDGSDTIGGRVPGTVTEFQRAADGTKKAKVIFKSDVDKDIDYQSFSQRMDSLLMNIPVTQQVRFVCDRKMGVPYMLSRYVEEHGGETYSWGCPNRVDAKSDEEFAAVDAGPFLKPMPRRVKPVDGKVRNLSVVMVEGFSEILPSMVGRDVPGSLDDDDAVRSNVFTLWKGGVRKEVRAFHPDGYICYTVAADRSNQRIIERGSYAKASGLTFLRVCENMSESDQVSSLVSGCASAVSQFVTEMDFGGSLFDGELRKEWKLSGKGVSSLSGEDGVFTLPCVFGDMGGSVSVGGGSYRTVFGVFAALMADAVGMDSSVYSRITSSSMEAYQVLKEIRTQHGVDNTLEERCMRQAVRMCAASVREFGDMLLSTADDVLVMPSSLSENVLFTDLNGKGENRFALVLSSERSRLAAGLAEESGKMEEVEKDDEKRSKGLVSRRADVRIEADGLPDDVSGMEGSVWFVGTDRSRRLSAGNGDSVVFWEEMANCSDRLTRGKAINNNGFVYLFPTDQHTQYLYRKGILKKMSGGASDSSDLTGLVKFDERTGDRIEYTFGVPVKRNRYTDEFGNAQGRACSYRLDVDSGRLSDDLVSVDAAARSLAIKYGMPICFAGHMYADGKRRTALSRVFADEIYGYMRTVEKFDRNTGKTLQEGGIPVPVSTKVRRFNPKTRRYETVTEERIRQGWVDNPHKSSRNYAVMRRYEDFLISSRRLPLNCICLPKDDYSETGLEVFLSDLTFVLGVANAAAVSAGMPLRIPLDREGRYALGPGVPEEFLPMAANRIDSFLKRYGLDSSKGVERITRAMDGANSPVVNPETIFGPGSGSGEVYLRPNDLAAAFGRYDFREVEGGSRMSLHEMMFVTDDGVSFCVRDPYSSNSRTSSQKRDAFSYRWNPQRRFEVRSSSPERIPAFISSFLAYIETAKGIRIETRLVDEMSVSRMVGEDLSLEGFVKLSDSNDSSLVDSTSVQLRDEDALTAANRFDGTDRVDEYCGKVLAGDGFTGYVQVRYALGKDDEFSSWHTVKDTDLALEVVLSKISRVYSSGEKLEGDAARADLLLRGYVMKEFSWSVLKFMQESYGLLEDRLVDASVMESVGQKERSAKAARRTENLPKVEIVADGRDRLDVTVERNFSTSVKKMKIRR